VKKTTRFYPRPRVDVAATGAVGQAGGVLLTQTVVASGLGRELSAALSPWRRPFAMHDPAKVLLDLAITVAIGGEHLDDAALLRAEPAVCGLVASDPTIPRTIARLAEDAGTRLPGGPCCAGRTTIMNKRNRHRSNQSGRHIAHTEAWPGLYAVAEGSVSRTRARVAKLARATRQSGTPPPIGLPKRSVHYGNSPPPSTAYVGNPYCAGHGLRSGGCHSCARDRSIR